MKKLLLVLMSVLSLGALSAGAAVTENCWKPEVTSGKWSNPENWSLGHVPTDSEQAAFVADCPSCTVEIDGDFTVSKFYAYAKSGTTLTFVGEGSLSVTGGEEYFRRAVVIDGPALSFPNALLMAYSEVSVLSGSLTVASYYRYTGAYSLIVDGGAVTCTGAFRYYTTTKGQVALQVKSGNFTAAAVYGGAHKTDGPREDNYFSIDVSGGMAEIDSLDFTVGCHTALQQTGGELHLTNGTLSDQTTVSRTGGTLKFVGDVTLGPGSLYEQLSARLGMRPALNDAVVGTVGGEVLVSADPIVAMGVKIYEQANPQLLKVGTFVFTSDTPFAWTDGYQRNVYVYGPTVFRTDHDMVYAKGSAANNVYVSIQGQVVADTRDWSDPTVGRNLFVSGLHSYYGLGELIVRGNGTFLARPYASCDSFKSVSVESGATLELADRESSTWGHLMAEAFALGSDATLKLTAGGSFVQADAWEIDPTAKIVVTVPDAPERRAWPILQDLGSKDLPASLVDQVQLVNAPAGMYVTCAAGQLSVCWRDSESLGKWGDCEWTGAGANAKWSTAANWAGGAAPIASQRVFFGAASATDPDFDKAGDGGTTIGGICFETNAVDAFHLNGTQMTIGATPAIESHAGVPQRISLWVRVTRGRAIGSYDAAPLLLDYSKGFEYGKAPTGVLTLGGDIRFGGANMSFPQMEFESTAYPQAVTRLTILDGASMTFTNQTGVIYGLDAGFRVEAGGVLTFKAGNGTLRRDRSSHLQVIHGTMEVQVPLVGGFSQSFGGTGRLVLSGGMDSGASRTKAANSRVTFADRLNVWLPTWSTVSSGEKLAYGIRAAGCPVLHVTDGWRYGPAAGVVTETPVEDRALVVTGGSTLTLEADGGTVRFADPFVGDAATAHLPSTLAISNGTLTLDGTFETDVGVKTLAGGTLSVEADQAIGGFASVAGATVAFAAGAALDVAGDVSLAGFAPVLAQPDEANRWRTLMRVAKGRTITLPTAAAGDELKYRVRATATCDEVQCRKKSGTVLIFK